MKLSLIAFLVASVVAFGQQPQQTDKTDQVLKQLIEISKTLDSMKKDAYTRMSKTEGDIQQLRTELRTLQKAVTILHADSTKQVAAPPKELTVPLRKDIPVEDVTLILSNSWSGTAHLLINGKILEVPSGSTRSVKVFPGNFSYQCLDNPQHKLQTRILISGETFCINVVPQTSTFQQQALPPTVPYYQPAPTYYYYPPCGG
jgi:hypothetical protein